ncbi:MAG TPA: efflux RND transporter periplasmic adaptor subunit [Nevskiaceae bacterium]|nr:efflux RND transporter periplasmic adaptor subunit [Nevskiaceae bacterium]
MFRSLPWFRLGLGLALVSPALLAQERPPAPVEVTRAQQVSLAPSVTASGQVQARTGAELAAGVAGRLAWVAEPGSEVARGAVVARMDVDEIRLQRLEQAARLTRAEVALKQAARELERLEASGSAVSRFQLDQARNARDLAEADREIARAALSQTDERLSRTELRAPFAGVVSERLKREGEEVARGEALLRLQDAGQLEIRLFLPLRHVRAIQAGSPVKVEAEDGRRLAARVRTVVPLGDLRSQSFEALIDAPPGLVAGSSVRVELPLASPVQTLAVPRDAVVIRNDGLSVYVVREGKTVSRVPVTTGVAAGPWVAIQGAVKADDAVVVRGAETLHDGDPVTVIGARDEWTTAQRLDSPSSS